jgi:prepilin-type N-terminal cleavage/methylation domain-containing protein
MIGTAREHNAFTMLELIFVIIILGIVSSIGASIIAQVYESYIVQRAQYRANIKTELAINQIANRLRYAIPATVGVRESVITDTFEDITTTTKENVKVLQWVGYDGDSFEAINSSTFDGASRRPGWSGFCDVNATINGVNTLSTPGSNLDLASEIITNLKGSLGNSRIYFADYNGNSYGVASGTGETLTMDSAFASGTPISERYKLAWSSYALEVDSKGDLNLYYNFDPTAQAAISNASKSLLLRSVTNFRFKYSGGVFRIKICKREPIGSDANATIHVCKEKVVF